MLCGKTSSDNVIDDAINEINNVMCYSMCWLLLYISKHWSLQTVGLALSSLKTTKS